MEFKEHKISQEFRKDLTKHFSKRHVFQLSQLVETVVNNADGYLVVEDGIHENAPTKVLTVVSAKGEAVESYQYSLPCPPFCPEA